MCQSTYVDTAQKHLHMHIMHEMFLVQQQND